MAVAGLAIVIATIVGGDGNQADIDRGAVDGLDQGDKGAIHYTLLIRGEPKRIDVGTAEIRTLADRSATLQVSSLRPVGPGYQVEFQVPTSRSSPTRLLTLARARQASGDNENALLYLDLIRERLGDDPFVLDQIEELEADLRAQEETQAEADDLGYFLTAARHYLDRDDLATANDYIERAERTAGEAQEVQDLRGELKSRLERAEQSEKRAGMGRLAAGNYPIGLDIAEADFFNQQPRHQAAVDELWVDREPVRLEHYRRFRPNARTPRNGLPPFVSGVSFADATSYCASIGKRLATETEWEAAASEGLLGSSQGLNEWTASWYQPYPGNDRSEADYGRTHRVLRRLLDDKPRALHRRRFLAPTETHPSVGFRCAASD